MRKSPNSTDRPVLAALAAELRRARRVAIVGNQGAGKTTLAERLQGLLGIPYVEIIWNLDGMDASQAREIRDEMARRESWIIDGEFGLLDLADVVIHLDFPLPLCVWRATKRSLQNFRAWDFKSARVFFHVPGKTLLLLRFLALVCRHPLRERPSLVPELELFSAKGHATRLTAPKQVIELLEIVSESSSLSSARDMQNGKLQIA